MRIFTAGCAWIVLAVGFLSFMSAGARATTITFDDLPTPFTYGTQISDGYAGLQWTGFQYLDGTHLSSLSGYQYGVISPDNVAFNGFGGPSSISATTGQFDLISGWFTGAWNDGLKITVSAYRSNVLLYKSSFVVDATVPTLETFNFFAVDTVRFGSTGGVQHPGFAVSAPPFVMDDLTVTPEPATLSLLALGGLLIARRRRA